MAQVQEDVSMTDDLYLNEVDDELIALLDRRAARHGRSVEDEHREILREALANEDNRSFAELAAELRERTKGRTQTPSEILQREGRDER